MIENFEKLDAGRIDWFVTGLYLGQAYLATHPTAHPILILSPPISTGDIHFGFSKVSPWKVQLLQHNLTQVLRAPKGSFPGE